MSVGAIQITLQSWREDGRGVSAEEFLAPLNLQPGEVEATQTDGGAWASGLVYLATVNFSEFTHVDASADAGAPREAFGAAIQEAFRAAARFLDQRPPEVTARLRAAGLSLKLFVEIRMNQDQMDLEFPPVLLAACGRHDLGIFLISNDIPAAEVLAARAAE